MNMTRYPLAWSPKKMKLGSSLNSNHHSQLTNKITLNHKQQPYDLDTSHSLSSNINKIIESLDQPGIDDKVFSFYDALVESKAQYIKNVNNIIIQPTTAIIMTLSLLYVSCPSVSFASDDSTLVVVSVAKPVIDTVANILSVLFLCRVILSWYPNTNLRQFPYNIVAWPTEALAAPVRGLIPPAFGVDISSLVWIALLSFVKEILTGQQGILTLLERNTIDL